MTGYKLIFLYSFCLALITGLVGLEVNGQDSSHDLYKGDDGKYRWCLFCLNEDLQQSKDFQRQCVQQNPNVLNKNAVLWCFVRGRPPTCDMIDLPENTEWNNSDAYHPLYTHTQAVVSCKEGFVRRPSGQPPNVTLSCLSTRQWDIAIPEDFRCAPEEDIPNVEGSMSMDLHIEEIPDEEGSVSKASKPDIPNDSATAPERLGMNKGLIAVLVVLSCLFGLTGGALLVKRRFCRTNPPPQSPSEEAFDVKTQERGDCPGVTGKLLTGSHSDGLPSPDTGSLSDSKSTLSSSDSPQTPEKEVVGIPAKPFPDHALGSPDMCVSCTSPLSDVEHYGDVHRRIAVRLDPASTYGDNSWKALAKSEGYSLEQIIYIQDKKKDDMFFGQTHYVMQQMIERGRNVGHLIRVLHSIGCQDLVQKILGYHLGCPYCQQFITSCR